mgnify:CR=1 FL=1
MATKKKQRIQSVRGFIKKSLHKRHALIDHLVRRLNDLDEDYTFECWSDDPDECLIEELAADIKSTEDRLKKMSETNIVLSGKEWDKLLELKMFGDMGLYYWLDGIAIDIAFRSVLNPNEKYRLGWWIGGELMLFPLIPSGRKRRLITMIDRDDSSMYPCLKKVMVSEPSATKNPIDSRFLWNRNERRGD